MGVDSNLSQPLAIKRLEKLGNVKVVKAEKGIFHPKMYIFHMLDKRVVWVGSANFTNYGLNKNEEIVAEVEIDNLSSIEWFEEKWKKISQQNSDVLLADFCQQWRPIADAIKNQTDCNNNETLDEIDLNCRDWKSYIDQLKQLNNHWISISSAWDCPFSVLEDAYSYLSVIADGHEIIRKKSWDKLSDLEVTMLLVMG